MITKLFEFAWRIVPALPAPLVRFIFALAGDLAWLFGTKGAQQLERNLGRVLDTRERSDLRAVTRAGMRSYLRYYGDALRMPNLSHEQIGAMVRMTGRERLEKYLREDRPCVLALGHLGNWDLAGAWSGLSLAPVTTVAERLKPDELFEDFLRLREGVGMDIVPLDHDGSAVFAKLIERLKSGGRRIMPLLADRDLGSNGVEVQLFGQPARVAPGPAALAVTCGAPLFSAVIYYERLHGTARRQAGGPWGLVVEIGPEIEVPATGTTRAKVQVATQAWVDAIADGIRRHPTDWHMLQKVFVADLDQAKDRAIRSGHRRPGGE